MHTSKVRLKKSQEHVIKVIGLVLAVILLVTFVVSSSSINIGAVLVSRGSTSTEIKYPTKPPVISACNQKCQNSLNACLKSQEGSKTCYRIFDQCVSQCRQQKK